MRYHNRESGLEINLGELDTEKKHLYERAQKLFRSNASWFAFEQVVFTYTSPLFHRSRNRADVFNDPLYKALKEMWLQLGIDQGFVAPRASDDRTTKTKARAADTHGTAVIRDVAPSHEPRAPRRRGR
jgi:hypothetical protein